ncbi:MAG: DMT family transporter [Pseudomonadota bacterium]|nr:DMT family transporter [Pseudomonadota bacterium]
MDLHCGKTHLRYLIIFVIGVAGIGLAVQAATNARMSEIVHAPVLSALINFVVGGIALAIILALGFFGRGTLSRLDTTPWWVWIGGILGALWITVANIAVPRIGTAATFTAVICGQLIGTLVLDTVGLLGVPRIPLSPWRIVGAMLLLAGVLLMQRK